MNNPQIFKHIPQINNHKYTNLGLMISLNNSLPNRMIKFHVIKIRNIFLINKQIMDFLKIVKILILISLNNLTNQVTNPMKIMDKINF